MTSSGRAESHGEQHAHLVLVDHRLLAHDLAVVGSADRDSAATAADHRDAQLAELLDGRQLHDAQRLRRGDHAVEPLAWGPP